MLDEETRSTILTLHAAGHGKRAIARLFGISRNAAKQILAAGTSKIPLLERAEKAEPHHDEIVQLVHDCKGHLGRVHEELEAQPRVLPASRPRRGRPLWPVRPRPTRDRHPAQHQGRLLPSARLRWRQRRVNDA